MDLRDFISETIIHISNGVNMNRLCDDKFTRHLVGQLKYAILK